MIGLVIKMECPACGNILTKVAPADNISILKRNLVDSGVKCGCGRKGKFRVFDFQRADFVPVAVNKSGEEERVIESEDAPEEEE